MKVGVVGCGLIGKSWAMLFASIGHKVSLYDENPAQVEKALKEIKDQLYHLERQELLRGNITAQEQISLITASQDLPSCVKDASHVQESIPEDLTLKTKLLTKIDELINDETIVCSSTSCIIPSALTKDLVHRSNFLVAHPVNPPYFVPLVELVPAPWTSENAIEKTKTLMHAIGQSPVVLKKEIPGFALNRIQYCILNECWRMVESDMLSVKDIDVIMKDGLGMRYAFMGPLETGHLNAEGWGSYCDRYADTIHRVSQTFGPNPTWKEGATVDNISRQLEEMIPISEIPAKRLERDDKLAQLWKLKKSF